MSVVVVGGAVAVADAAVDVVETVETLKYGLDSNWSLLDSMV